MRAEDLGRYYRVPSDNRDLNYDEYFVRGTEMLSALSDYTSDNTRRLTEDELGAMLLKLDYIQDELRTWRGIRGY